MGAGHAWGYAKSGLPPEKWNIKYPIATNGRKQSPVNFDPETSQNTKYPALELSYTFSDLKSVGNNGHTVTFSTSGGKSVLSGGPLKSKYTLEQFHFHWGANSTRGSEHTFSEEEFAAEVHFVHWNSEKYGSFKESLDYEDGLCVLGALIMSSETDNLEYKPVIDALKNVTYKGSKRNILKAFDFRRLLPEELSLYYHYSGSLTTPPLKECVQWIVFKMPVSMGEKQLQEFRKLSFGVTCCSEPMRDNYRPVQNIRARKVYSVGL